MACEDDSQSKDVVVVTAADDGYALPLAVTIRSALANLQPARRMRLYVLDGGLSDESKSRLLRSWGTNRLTVDWIAPDRTTVEGLEISRHVNLVTYFRLLMSAVLPSDVTRAIYLDADLLVRADLSRLWDEPQAGMACLAVADTAAPCIDASLALPSYARCKRYLAAARPIGNYRELGLDPAGRYLNGGVMVADLKLWRAERMAEKMLRCLREYRQHVRWWDQYALNVVLAGQWRQLDPRWNQGAHAYTFPTWQESPFEQEMFSALRHDPWIVHFTSRNKPWHYFCRHPFRRQFFATVDETEWRGWRPAPPANDRLRQWWSYQFAPVRQWWKVCSARARLLAVRAPRM